MARSQETFWKKEREKKKRKKAKDKADRREERKGTGVSGLENMLAYVDEYGNITDTPPDPENQVEIDLEDIDISIPKKKVIAMDTERTGKVDFFNDQKGFGFIKEIGTNESFFVHVHGLIDEINEGDKVTFELEKGMKGMNAIKVTKVK